MNTDGIRVGRGAIKSVKESHRCQKDGRQGQMELRWREETGTKRYKEGINVTEKNRKVDQRTSSLRNYLSRDSNFILCSSYGSLEKVAASFIELNIEELPKLKFYGSKSNEEKTLLGYQDFWSVLCKCYRPWLQNLKNKYSRSHEGYKRDGKKCSHDSHECVRFSRD